MNTPINDVMKILRNHFYFLDLVSHDPKEAFSQISEILYQDHKNLMSAKRDFFNLLESVQYATKKPSQQNTEKLHKITEQWLQAEELYWHGYQLEHIIRAAIAFHHGDLDLANRISRDILPSYCADAKDAVNHQCVQKKKDWAFATIAILKA